MTHEQFVKHWVGGEVHAPLATPSGLAALRGAVAHLEEAGAPTSPRPTWRTGIAELWFDDADALARGLSPPARKALHADGALFIAASRATPRKSA